MTGQRRVIVFNFLHQNDSAGIMLILVPLLCLVEGGSNSLGHFCRYCCTLFLLSIYRMLCEDEVIHVLILLV